MQSNLLLVNGLSASHAAFLGIVLAIRRMVQHAEECIELQGKDQQKPAIDIVEQMGSVANVPDKKFAFVGAREVTGDYKQVRSGPVVYSWESKSLLKLYVSFPS